MHPFELQAAVIMLALLYCATRCLVDFRARRFTWASISLALGLGLLATLLAPIQTRAVKVEFPVNDGS